MFEKLIFWHILSTFSQRKKEPETSTEGWQDSYSSQQWGTICQLPHLELCQLVSKNGEQRIQDTDSWNAEVAASLYSRKQASGYQKKQENIIYRLKNVDHQAVEGGHVKYGVYIGVWF